LREEDAVLAELKLVQADQISPLGVMAASACVLVFDS